VKFAGSLSAPEKEKERERERSLRPEYSELEIRVNKEIFLVNHSFIYRMKKKIIKSIIRLIAILEISLAVFFYFISFFFVSLQRTIAKKKKKNYIRRVRGKID
jgi:hypothetical protein